MRLLERIIFRALNCIAAHSVGPRGGVTRSRVELKLRCPSGAQALPSGSPAGVYPAWWSSSSSASVSATLSQVQAQPEVAHAACRGPCWVRPPRPRRHLRWSSQPQKARPPGLSTRPRPLLLVLPSQVILTDTPSADLHLTDLFQDTHPGQSPWLCL